MRSIRSLLLLLFVACASSTSAIRTVQAFRDARERGDEAAMQSLLAPDARMFFDKREGNGMLLGGTDEWSHWDTYFHGHSEKDDWKGGGERRHGDGA
jgi:hypothetical protein